MSSKRLLCTGIYGFIGSTFAKLVLEETDWHVIGFGREGESKNHFRLVGCDKYATRFDIKKGDLRDASSLSGLCEDIDFVVNFAARTFVDHSIVDPQSFVDSNIVGTYNLLEQARSYKVQKYVQVSTDEVYGAILTGAYKEDAPLNPTNPYSATKAGGDMLALSYFNTYKLPVIVTRNENVYGPFQHRQKAIPTFVRKALKDEALPVYGDGQHSRQWIHTDDTCRALLLLLEKGQTGQIYHIAGNQELTNLELAKLILQVLGKSEDLISFVPDHNVRPGHDRRYALDSTKLRALGWSPQYSIKEGLTQVVNWYRDNSWWLG